MGTNRPSVSSEEIRTGKRKRDWPSQGGDVTQHIPGDVTTEVSEKKQQSQLRTVISQGPWRMRGS